jgi:hypothetical protein
VGKKIHPGNTSLKTDGEPALTDSLEARRMAQGCGFVEVGVEALLERLQQTKCRHTKNLFQTTPNDDQRKKYYEKRNQPKKYHRY